MLTMTSAVGFAPSMKKSCVLVSAKLKNNSHQEGSPSRPARPASFDATRDVVMHDEAHIAAINAHAKGIRGHGDIMFLADEFVLSFLTLTVIESTVILDRLHVQLAQGVAHLFDLLAG